LAFCFCLILMQKVNCFPDFRLINLQRLAVYDYNYVQCAVNQQHINYRWPILLSAHIISGVLISDSWRTGTLKTYSIVSGFGWRQKAVICAHPLAGNWLERWAAGSACERHALSSGRLVRNWPGSAIRGYARKRLSLLWLLLVILTARWKRCNSLSHSRSYSL
jgi:hypothetical protein